MPILNLNNISKNFGAIEALKNVNFNLDKGQVVGLMGDNGAGKSTLIKIVAGVFQSTSGEILYNDKHVNFSKPIDARNSGIEVVYQDLALCDNLTAAANIFLSRELFKKIFYVPFLDYKKMYDISQNLFNELKSETRPRDIVKLMSGGQRQAVAIARTKLTDAKIVLMDEPTAAISVRQVAEVLDYIRQLRDQGISIILISHRMPDVFEVSDRIVVLRRGSKVADKKITDSSPEEVTGLITGALQTA